MPPRRRRSRHGSPAAGDDARLGKPLPGARRPGTIVGETYQVTRLIGQGGMGFRREAEIASKLTHPNIIQVVDLDTLSDGSPYSVLELWHGQSLAWRLARKAYQRLRANGTLTGLSASDRAEQS